MMKYNKNFKKNKQARNERSNPNVKLKTKRSKTIIQIREVLGQDGHRKVIKDGIARK